MIGRLSLRIKEVLEDEPCPVSEKNVYLLRMLAKIAFCSMNMQLILSTGSS
jgi:hypothetical protein